MYRLSVTSGDDDGVVDDDVDGVIDGDGRRSRLIDRIGGSDGL